jgi:hypothetical protein
MLADIRAFARFSRGLGRFLRERPSLEDSRRRIQAQLRDRSETFLRIFERGVFARADHPYRRLCEHVGIGFPELAELVRREGLEKALGRLYDSGVHLSASEFKGRAALERPGLSLPTRAEDFDNPLLESAYRVMTGRSRGVGTRVAVDLDLLAHDTAHNALSLAALGLEERPCAQWRPVPPAAAAMNNALRSARLGHPLERWFSQSRLELRGDALKYSLFAHYVIAASRRHGSPIPPPEYVPVSESERIAEWLATKVRSGRPAYFCCPSTAAVRICLIAAERRLDLAGTVFRIGGEPFTPAKAAILAGAGCSHSVRYSLSELGNIGMPCLNPTAPDSVHVLTDKIAVVQRERRVGRSGATVPALFVTTLLPATPKLMLNVDIGDYGELEERDCGCPIGALGFRLQIRSIRSHEKLTSEGMTFHGEDLIRLVEEILPARFGGYAGDYQLVEVEDGGLPHVDVVVSPRVGRVDERALEAAVLQELGSRRAAWRMAAEQWRQAGTLRVVRHEPLATPAGKILPLHVPVK